MPARVPAFAGGKPIFKKFLTFGEPVIGEDEINEVVSTLRSKWIGLGKKTYQFENEFSAFVQCEEMIALNSCTSALFIALKMLGLPKGSEVLVPSMTFCAAANAVELCGYHPVFMDCEQQTYCVGVREIQERVSAKTRAVIVVHFGGYPCNMPEIHSFCSERGIPVIEDCAHAIEAFRAGKHVGVDSFAAVYSFYATKNLTTSEGGMLYLKDTKLREKARQFSLNGMTQHAWKRYSDSGHVHYDIISPGLKFNMTDLQASLGIHQLKRITPHWEIRKRLWHLYLEGLKDLPLQLPAHTLREDDVHAYHLFSPLLDSSQTNISRDRLLDALIKENIGVGIHYHALHACEYYSQRYGIQTDHCPVAHEIGERTFSLPLSPGLGENQVQQVIEAVQSILEYSYSG